MDFHSFDIFFRFVFLPAVGIAAFIGVVREARRMLRDSDPGAEWDVGDDDVLLAVVEGERVEWPPGWKLDD